jgi:hypothetical protein
MLRSDSGSAHDRFRLRLLLSFLITPSSSQIPTVLRLWEWFSTQTIQQRPQRGGYRVNLRVSLVSPAVALVLRVRIIGAPVLR